MESGSLLRFYDKLHPSRGCRDFKGNRLVLLTFCSNSSERRIGRSENPTAEKLLRLTRINWNLFGIPRRQDVIRHKGRDIRFKCRLAFCSLSEKWFDLCRLTQQHGSRRIALSCWKCNFTHYALEAIIINSPSHTKCWDRWWGVRAASRAVGEKRRAQPTLMSLSRMS